MFGIHLVDLIASSIPRRNCSDSSKMSEYASEVDKKTSAVPVVDATNDEEIGTGKEELGYSEEMVDPVLEKRILRKIDLNLITLLGMVAMMSSLGMEPCRLYVRPTLINTTPSRSNEYRKCQLDWFQHRSRSRRQSVWCGSIGCILDLHYL